MSSILAVAILFSLSGYLITSFNQESNLAWAVEQSANHNNGMFNSLLYNQGIGVSALISSFMVEDKYKEKFMDQDRDGLYGLTEDLYDSLNNKYDITHFYYMNADREIFLRMHQKDRNGDICQRITCKESQEEKQISSGIEFGPLMYFTLRVVEPYYSDDELIGYIEFGKEIDGLTNIFKEVTGNDVSLLVDKNHINKTSWDDAMDSRGLENDWGALESHVLVATSIDCEESALDRYGNCFDPEKLKTIKDAGVLLDFVEDEDGRHVASSGFPLYDASGEQVGVIIFHEDVTDIIHENKRVLDNVVIVIWALTIFSLIISVLLYFYTKGDILDPLKKLTSIADDISSGEIDVKIPKKLQEKGDEIGDVSRAFAKLISSSHAIFSAIVESKTNKITKKKGSR